MSDKSIAPYPHWSRAQKFAVTSGAEQYRQSARRHVTENEKSAIV